jgi:protein SHQ1
LRIENENEKFEDDHYLADLFDNNYIESVLLKYKPDFGGNGDEEDEHDAEGFTQKEQDCLKQLPRKTFMLDKEQKFCAFAGLVDILFAYAYNNRVNCGETNVESGWTIVKLSSTLSWFDVRVNIVCLNFRNQ